jgi:hypothetical protein
LLNAYWKSTPNDGRDASSLLDPRSSAIPNVPIVEQRRLRLRRGSIPRISRALDSSVPFHHLPILEHVPPLGSLPFLDKSKVKKDEKCEKSQEKCGKRAQIYKKCSLFLAQSNMLIRESSKGKLEEMADRTYLGALFC